MAAASGQGIFQSEVERAPFAFRASAATFRVIQNVEATEHLPAAQSDELRFGAPDESRGSPIDAHHAPLFIEEAHGHWGLVIDGGKFRLLAEEGGFRRLQLGNVAQEADESAAIVREVLEADLQVESMTVLAAGMSFEASTAQKGEALQEGSNSGRSLLGFESSDGQLEQLLSRAAKDSAASVVDLEKPPLAIQHAAAIQRCFEDELLFESRVVGHRVLSGCQNVILRQ